MKAKRSAAVLAAVFSSRRPARKRVGRTKPDTATSTSQPASPPHETDVGTACTVVAPIVQKEGRKKKKRKLDTPKLSVVAPVTVSDSQPSASISAPEHNGLLQGRNNFKASTAPNDNKKRKLASNLFNGPRAQVSPSQDKISIPAASVGSSPVPSASHTPAPSSPVTLPLASAGRAATKSSKTAEKKQKLAASAHPPQEVSHPPIAFHASSKVSRPSHVAVSSAIASVLAQSDIHASAPLAATSADDSSVPVKKKKKMLRNKEASPPNVAQPSVVEKTAAVTKRKKVLRKKVLPASSVAQPSVVVVEPEVAESIEPIDLQPAEPVVGRPRPGNGCYPIQMPRPIVAVDRSSPAFRLVATLTVCRHHDVEEKLAQELDRGWPPEALSAALGYCADRGQTSSVRLLIARSAPLDVKTGLNCRTALQIAARNGHVDICSLLVGAGADQTGAREAVESLSLYGQLFAKEQANIEALLR